MIVIKLQMSSLLILIIILLIDYIQFLILCISLSCVDITGINVTEEAELKQIFDLFSQTRLGNESNPFVVDVRVAHVPVHDDIEDNQEFNDM